MLRLVGRVTPDQGHGKRKQETDEIEFAPCLEPAGAEHDKIQQQIIREQQHMIAAAGGRENRRQERTQQAERRKRACVEFNSERNRRNAERREQQKPERRADQRKSFQREKDVEIQETHRAAEQDQCVGTLFLQQLKAGEKHRNAGRGHTQQPH